MDCYNNFPMLYYYLQALFLDHPDAAMVREVLGRKPDEEEEEEEVETDQSDEEESEENDTDPGKNAKPSLSTRNAFTALLDDSS